VFLAGGRGDVWAAIWLSIKSSTITTLIVLVLGVPLAYVMVRAEFPGKGLADNLLDLPILIPQPVVAIAILTCIAPKTRLGSFLMDTRLGGLLGEPLGFHIDGTIWGIVAAQVFVASPFLVRAAMTAFQGIDPKLEKVARTLGARPWQAFRSVSLPLAAKGIFTGCILTWARAISEYGAVAMITYDPACAPVRIYDDATAHGVPEARPAAVLLVITCLWIFVMLRLIRAYPVGGALAALVRKKRA
jgi:molybdate/tungstate transport system permease protein